MNTKYTFTTLLTLALVLTACAPKAMPESPQTSATEAPPAAVTEAPAAQPGQANTAAVALENFQFNPAKLEVKVGTTVVWTNNDSVGHTVTADDGAFNSGTLRKGDTFSFTFTEAGAFAYYCQPHGGKGGQGMSGMITVVP